MQETVFLTEGIVYSRMPNISGVIMVIVSIRSVNLKRHQLLIRVYNDREKDITN